MKIGIKTGLKGDYRSEVLSARPDFCEVWYNAGKAAEYQDLFKFLRSRNISFGLHFWGALSDMTLTNLAYPNKDVNERSIKMYRETIETGAKYNCLYVNIHPHGYKLTRVDFTKEEFRPYSDTFDKKSCLDNLYKNMNLLSGLAVKNGVPIFIESAPKYANGTPWTGPVGRLKPVFIGEIPVTDLDKALFELPQIYFANDFGHTGSVMENSDRKNVFDFIMRTTKKFFSQTRLLHIGYLIPPFIGTDYHGSLLDPEFDTNSVVPNKSEMIKLLRLFKNRDDVLALVEPEKDHVANFLTLKKLISQL